ncbi:hypothetical protein HK099_008474 [Clydaea vesicula]|uniref:Uncharacterized protein n=1 Tax=Clydaea vesicula TaxID=447962 RepID=A0AAD5TW37_9FUNG|nr:hypothetical protein HK099_008474 [Clydaea vesicula]
MPKLQIKINKEIDEVNEEQKENGIELLESEIISEKQFRNFEKDPEFLKLVRDPILQQTILTLEKDSNKEILYSTLMKTNKTFVDFTDYILQHLDEQCT